MSWSKLTHPEERRQSDSRPCRDRACCLSTNGNQCWVDESLNRRTPQMHTHWQPTHCTLSHTDNLNATQWQLRGVGCEMLITSNCPQDVHADCKAAHTHTPTHTSQNWFGLVFCWLFARLTRPGWKRTDTDDLWSSVTSDKKTFHKMLWKCKDEKMQIGHIGTWITINLTTLWENWHNGTHGTSGHFRINKQTEIQMNHLQPQRRTEHNHTHC